VAIASWPAGAIRSEAHRFSREMRAHAVLLELLSDPQELLSDIERARDAHRSGQTISPAELDKRLFG
jgi:hypothetical protein